MSTAVQFRGGTTAQHATFTGAAREITVDTDKNTVVVHDGATAGGFPLARHDLVKTAFIKADKSAVAFTRTGNATASIKAGTIVEVNGKLVQFTADTAITMPALTAGTDYAIYVCDDGTVRADSNFSAPTGYTSTTARKVGGFHYAPGSNAAAQAGGNTTAQINEYSLWDIKFRPAALDPRGMTLVAGAFWADIYLLGVNHLTDGTSKYNVTIADGSASPKKSTKFGGDGSAAYSDGAWYNFAEVMTHHGKRLPNYNEFQALAFGTTEATSSGGTDVPTTGVNGTGATSAWNIFTSKWGVVQASGCLWTWGNEFGGVNGASEYTANTGGRGSVYAQPAAALFGGAWNGTSLSGSRAALWYSGPSFSFAFFGARGVCDHLILE
ncbi:tail protein [Bordetella phage BPP-1]|uniref:Tail fiber receptor-binding protein n=2 Tax=Rauchvirus TaxID=542959 RepID=FIBD_BPBPP|nr:tail protein [Bordetella phage BPP-1]Q775D6.1 RecName: Full=Tail fiber receptor-binding protein; AltName: Full=Major tropism determinant protein [Bordetella phage BPP-1]AAR97674.1 phage tail protein [Bordetella phage BPP-1]1YU0_A Chain A, Major Tropism Determinant (Mtd-P1) [Bordetella phage BPP-1]